MKIFVKGIRRKSFLKCRRKNFFLLYLKYEIIWYASAAIKLNFSIVLPHVKIFLPLYSVLIVSLGKTNFSFFPFSSFLYKLSNQRIFGKSKLYPTKTCASFMRYSFMKFFSVEKFLLFSWQETVRHNVHRGSLL